MAYISAQDVKAIREELKAEFPKFKFGVRKGSGSLSVDVTIKSGTSDFSDIFTHGQGYAQINQYHLGNYGDHQTVLSKINEIMHNAPGRVDPSRKYFDESDAMTDYFHTAFYTHLQIGAWDKPYTVTK
ncbi:hypothetical protein UFOVP71_177 [uncultured Caudovirales phage]|uniref:Large polyvalent protein associated domain-containing protein n=1 Tax=uncultured Caudovirales phage TaxID=2100421 RepID=A0A6J5TBI2_9CAUD|nr:hypothetical protein UFOVP71_177 [uncultured Caudovirales phage]